MKLTIITKVTLGDQALVSFDKSVSFSRNVSRFSTTTTVYQPNRSQLSVRRHVISVDDVMNIKKWGVPNGGAVRSFF